jgi:hypothetical protein
MNSFREMEANSGYPIFHLAVRMRAFPRPRPRC